MRYKVAAQEDKKMILFSENGKYLYQAISDNPLTRDTIIDIGDDSPEENFTARGWVIKRLYPDWGRGIHPTIIQEVWEPELRERRILRMVADSEDDE